MTIGFFTEAQYAGKVPRDYPNMRTDLAWVCALEADHFNLYNLPNRSYDLGIIIIPKKNPAQALKALSAIKTVCKKIAIMQEGPNWLWQDWDVPTQVQYFNALSSVDYIFAHNVSDVGYFKGLTNHPNVYTMPSLMIEDTIKDLPQVERKGAMIGGNFTSWYSGFDSMIIAQLLGEGKICAPSMGRRQPYEEQLVEHLPYMPWTDWIKELNKFKFGVHLMRTHAAGTFALNCAYLGIPCIGYTRLDTQMLLHPNLAVRDLQEAREMAEYLRREDTFYWQQSALAKENYAKYYSEENFKQRILSILEK